MWGWEACETGKKLSQDQSTCLSWQFNGSINLSNLPLIHFVQHASLRLENHHPQEDMKSLGEFWKKFIKHYRNSPNVSQVLKEAKSNPIHAFPYSRDWQTTVCNPKLVYHLLLYSLRSKNGFSIFKWLQIKSEKTCISWHVEINEIQTSLFTSKVLPAHSHLTYLHIASGFCATMAELSSCN